MYRPRPNANLRRGKPERQPHRGAESFSRQQTSRLAHHPWGASGRYRSIDVTPPSAPLTVPLKSGVGAVGLAVAAHGAGPQWWCCDVGGWGGGVAVGDRDLDRAGEGP